MELSKKQKILIAAVFFFVVFLVVLFFMMSSYNQMEDDGEMMTAEDIAFYQEAKSHIGSEYETLAASKGWKYQSLAGRYHSPQSQYNPQFTISEGEQFCGDIVMQQNINYVTALDDITCNTRFECTAADWDETVQAFYAYIPDIVQLHNMYGTEELTEESLAAFISASLPADAPADEPPRPDPNDKSQLMLLTGYYPEDDSYHDPHYKILLFITDYIDESKLPDRIS